LRVECKEAERHVMRCHAHGRFDPIEVRCQQPLRNAWNPSFRLEEVQHDPHNMQQRQLQGCWHHCWAQMVTMDAEWIRWGAEVGRSERGVLVTVLVPHCILR
jgi:hypothetical protein